ncbi:MAG: hypothetical protein HDT18_01470 [Oscillibacter sp.]|nr:hypothetical protein [Oscillibacter sp.]
MALPLAQAAVVRLRYLEGLTLDEVGARRTSKRAVKEAEERALDRLVRGKYRREPREWRPAHPSPNRP